MAKTQTLPDRALELVEQIGGNLKAVFPDQASKWIGTGAALGALKTGGRLTGGIVRRHPAAAVAAVAGAGLLWYLARRKARQSVHDALEGSATHVEAKRGARKPRTNRQ